MGGLGDGSSRDRATIERELRLLTGVRDADRERDGATPSLDQIDALLDELIELMGTGRHRREDHNPDARPSLWRSGRSAPR